MKDEINRRATLAFAVPAFFMVWFLLIGTAVFLNYENIIYSFPVYQSREPLVLTSGLVGGYVMCGLLCGTMFTTACLGQVGTGAKVTLTVLFVLPLFLAVTGVVYVIPYYIYNICRIIYLKSKKKNAYTEAVQKQPQRSTVPSGRAEPPVSPVYSRPQNNYAVNPSTGGVNVNVNRSVNNTAIHNAVSGSAVPYGAVNRAGTGAPSHSSTYSVPPYGRASAGVNRTVSGTVPNSVGKVNTGINIGSAQGITGSGMPFVQNTAGSTAVVPPVVEPIVEKATAPKRYSNPYHDGFEMDG